MRGTWLLVIMVAIGLLAGAATRRASAETTGVVHVASGTAFVGEDVSVGVGANVGEPGLGTWTIDITYDSTVVSAAGCVGTSAYSVCSTTIAPQTVLVTGAHTTGLVGELSLATFAFRCDRAGTSQLSISVRVFADSTPDNPQPINVEFQNGTITCVAPTATATALPTASATPGPALPPSGQGSAASPMPPWPFVGLAAGAASVVAALAPRRRA